jgi:3-isopropylmalate/(R)-2-methylmalate dehydratase small subunit
MAELFRRHAAAGGSYDLTVDLERQLVADGAGFQARFTLDDYYREKLLRGLDEIGLTLLHADRIAAFERRREAWLAGTEP